MSRAFDAAWERYSHEPHGYCDAHHVAHAADEGCEECIAEQAALYAAADEADADLELVECCVCEWLCVPELGAMGRLPVCAECAAAEFRESAEAEALAALEIFWRRQ